MSRLARRRSDPVPLPRPSRTRLLRAIWPWVAPALSLVIATALVFWLESSGLWSPLRTGILALDFDPSRAALILAWLAGIVLAIVATLLGGRPWLAALAATVFVAVTYAWPLGERLRQEVPTIFGLKEQLQPGVVWHNQLVALAITLLAALIGAATADRIPRGAFYPGR